MRMKLGDVCERNSSNLKLSDVMGKSGRYPIYGASGYIGNIDFYHQEKAYIAVVKDGAGIGRTTLHPPKSSVIGTMQYLLPKENVLPEYLFYVVRYMHLEKYFTGATIPHIYFKDYKNEQFNLDSLERQAEIVSVLHKCEEIVEKKKQELKLFDELVRGRFVELFGDPIENPKRYYVATLQELIDKDYITYHLDGNHGGDYPRSEEFVASGVPYISANCIVNGEIDFSKAKFLTSERAGKLRKGIAQDEDVLFAHNATVGPTVVLHTDEEKVILGTSLTAYRCNKDEIMPNYLKAYMLSDGFVRQYSGEMKQTTRNQVPITAQKKYLFLIPPIKEQNQFADFVHQIDKSKFRGLSMLTTIKSAYDQQTFIYP